MKSSPPGPFCAPPVSTRTPPSLEDRCFTPSSGPPERDVVTERGRDGSLYWPMGAPDLSSTPPVTREFGSRVLCPHFSFLSSGSPFFFTQESPRARDSSRLLHTNAPSRLFESCPSGRSTRPTPPPSGPPSLGPVSFGPDDCVVPKTSSHVGSVQNGKVRSERRVVSLFGCRLRNSSESPVGRYSY